MPINPETITWDDTKTELPLESTLGVKPEFDEPRKATSYKIPHTPSVPFDIDGYIEEEGKVLPVGQDVKGDWTEVMNPIIRPFAATALTTARAVNEGLGTFSVHLDTIADYIGEKTGFKAGNIFEDVAKAYEDNAEYWKNRADKVGISFIDELLGEAIGGAPAGVGEFILNMPYFALLGSAEARKSGKSEIAGALVEGGKRGILGLIFKAIHPLKQYLRAPTMGTVFGVQSAAEGGDFKDMAKGFGTGTLYSMASPGGRMGLNEVKDGIKSEMAFLKARAKALERFAPKPIPKVEKGEKVEPGPPPGPFEEPGLKGIPKDADLSDVFWADSLNKSIVEVVESKIGGTYGDKYEMKIRSPRNETIKEGERFRNWDTDRKHPREETYDSTLVDEQFKIIDDRYVELYKFKPLKVDTVSPDTLWRGMAADELVASLKSGELKSEGAMNFEAQKGKTLYSTNPSQAANYAAGFAAWWDRPTYNKPSYVVELKRPPGAKENAVNEIEVEGGVPIDSIEKVYEIRLSSEEPGSVDLIREYGPKFAEGSRSTQTQHFAARELDKSEVAKLVGEGVKAPGETEAQPDTYAIHYGKERYDVVKPTPKGGEVSAFSKEVQARMDASTKMTDYVPLSNAYEVGARVEQGSLGKTPHVVETSSKRIYDLSADKEGYWDKAKARVEKDPEIQSPDRAQLNNAVAAELKESGKYDGFTVTHGKDKWFSFFYPQKVVDPSVKTKIRFSTMVGSVETVGPGLEDVAKVSQEKRIEAETQIRELKKSYPELKISVTTPTAARFKEATEGVMEHGGTVTVDGPLAAVRSFYSEMGLKNDQYAIMIDRPGVANASKIGFRVHKSKTKQAIEDAFRKHGLEEFNIEEPTPGVMKVDMVVGDYLEPAEQSRIRDALIKIADEIGEPGKFEDVRINSEVIGSFDDVAPIAKSKIVAPGSDTTPVSQTYSEGAKSPGNVWVRQSKAKSNKDRVLLIQVSSKPGVGKSTETVGENKYAAIGYAFFDKLYANREGYERPEDFWEIPSWIGMATRNFKKSDVYVVRDIEAAKKFLNEAGYGKVMFSAMDEHVPAIRGILGGYDGDVMMGGYVAKGTFKEFGNVKYFDSMAAAANEMGVRFKEGTDYRHFKGAKTIPRLCMSKGCLHNCAFCVAQKNLEVSDAKSIAEEAKSFGDLDYELVYLDDKTFGQAKNYKDLIKINKRLKKKNPNFKGFIIQTTAPQMTKFSDEFLRESGIKYVELGVESYNDAILKKVNKPAREKNIDKAVEIIRKHGLQFIPNVMVGLSGKGWSETAATYKRTLDFLKKNADVISHVNIYNLAVYEGTKLSEQVAEGAGVGQNVIKPSSDKIHEKFYKDVIDLGIKVLDKGPQKKVEYKEAKATASQEEYKKNILAYWGPTKGEERYDAALREGQSRTFELSGRTISYEAKEEKVERPEIATMIEPPRKPEDRKGPLFTEAQIKRRATAKAKYAKQVGIQDAKEAQEAVHVMIRERRQNLNLAAYETNLFVNDIEKQTTRAEREAMPFIIEGTDIPKGLKRKDLEKILAKDDGKLAAIARQVKEHFDKGWEKIKENTPDMTVEQIENYITHIWDIPRAKRQEVTSWFSTQNRFLKKRYIETLQEGVDKFGLKPKVLDVGEIIRIHDGVMNRVIENNRLVEGLKGLKSEGVSLIERADKAPQDWVFMDHPALRRGLGIPMKDKETGEPKGIQVVKLPIKVHPDLKKPLEVIFSSRFDHEVIQAYEVLGGVLKKTTLSLSLFHHGALGETGAAIMGPARVANIYFNPVKIYKALVKGEFDVYNEAPLARDAVVHGLQLGATADIPVNMIQRKLNDFARKTKSIPIANKATDILRTFNETWDKALWDYLHDTLKLYGYEALTAKIDPAKDVKKQKQEIAQFVNDTFGGQNWDTLMVTPKSLQIMSWSLLSPDWTLSTVRQALSPTGIGKIHKETSGLRKKMGAHYWVKAALYFGAGINMLNYTFRKKDEEDNPQYYEGMGERSFMDRTMVGNTFGHKTHLFAGRYEDGTERYIRWGKQFRELPELFFDDAGFSPISATLKKVGGKMNPVLQLSSQIATGHSLSGFRNDDVSGEKGWDKVLGIGKTLIKAPFPFSTRALWDDNKEFHVTDLMMPSSKGMTRYKSMELFKYAIANQDEQYLKEVYQFTLRNNLPAYTLFKAGLTSLKAESTREYNEGLDTLNDAIEKLEETENIADLNRVQRTIARIQKEQTDRELGIDMLGKAILEMQVNEMMESAE